jgi:hypothetical protein
MGWTGSQDTLRQVRLKFPTKESAVAFAERHGLRYSVHAPPEERLQLKSYADNFRPRRWRNKPAPKTALPCSASRSRSTPIHPKQSATRKEMTS